MTKTKLLLFAGFVVTAVVPANALPKYLPRPVNDAELEECPPCDILFSRLQDSPDGTRSQHVDMQVRGEAKSGTSFMFKWASEALKTACTYLKRSFGESSCQIDEESVPGRPGVVGKISLVFEPMKASRRDARCRCLDVDR